jgi:hypothetical protein
LNAKTFNLSPAPCDLVKVSTFKRNPYAWLIYVAVLLACDGIAAASCAADDVVVARSARPARPVRGAQIRAELRRPHGHPRYGVELEPHFVVQWGDAPYRTGAGIGIGFRASIPVIDPGPLANVNNNLAVSFGIDWATFGACRFESAGCYGNDFWFPIVMQWNFYLTPWWSVFPELGFAVRHATWGSRYEDDWADSDRGPPGRGRDRDDIGCGPRGDVYCGYSGAFTGISPVSWLGTRFSVSDAFSIVLRVGYPSLTAGVSFRM